MMTPQDEMKVRAGFYIGRAARDLNDWSYYQRWSGKAQNLTQAEYEQMASEIQARLLAAGKIQPDEDPAESIVEALRESDQGPVELLLLRALRKAL